MHSKLLWGVGFLTEIVFKEQLWLMCFCFVEILFGLLQMECRSNFLWSLSASVF